MVNVGTVVPLCTMHAINYSDHGKQYLITLIIVIHYLVLMRIPKQQNIGYLVQPI